MVYEIAQHLTCKLDSLKPPSMGLHQLLLSDHATEITFPPSEDT